VLVFSNVVLDLFEKWQSESCAKNIQIYLYGIRAVSAVEMAAALYHWVVV